MQVGRLILIVLDSVGIGELPDAASYGDAGSNTLANTARAVGRLRMPVLARWGLGNLTSIEGVPPVAPEAARAAFGRMAALSPGKDTMTAHWEMMGLILDKPLRTYPRGFPRELVERFEALIGRKVLGNVAASGTEIIARHGQEHMATGRPIVYTSADSVFQIAAHEEVIPVEELYRMCQVARELLTGDHLVGRVIARPFVGSPGGFRRTDRRKDFSLRPAGRTVLDRLSEAGVPVVGVGKITDIFSGQGITESHHAGGNMEAVEAILRLMRSGKEGLLFANLVDFDMLYGHRNDPLGYARALEEFDNRLPELVRTMSPQDIMVITADHGCDPTTPSTDHSREYVPLLAYGDQVRAGAAVGTRRSLSDLGATVADLFGLEELGPGESFARELVGVSR